MIRSDAMVGPTTEGAPEGSFDHWHVWGCVTGVEWQESRVECRLVARGLVPRPSELRISSKLSPAKSEYSKAQSKDVAKRRSQQPQRRVQTPSDIDRAIEVFARGFCFTRSFTHPYLAERVGPMWVVRDAPRKRGSYRNEEWIAYDVAPKEVDRLARKHTRGRFAICAIHAIGEADEPLRIDFKALGYRLGTTEPLMIHRLQRIPRCNRPATIQRVTTEEMAKRLAKAARSRQVLPEHLAKGSPLRAYVALLDNDIVGWVRCVVVGDAAWCATMYVAPAFRRRGIARSLMCRMLRDDRAGGAKTAVLLASHTGAKLYSAVGYEQIGTLLLFTPKKTSRT